MKLGDIIELMCIEGTAIMDLTITIKEHNILGRIFYKGSLREFRDYARNHKNLSQSDGFECDVLDIKNWSIVEILVDNTDEQENDTPSYNKGKIITIM